MREDDHLAARGRLLDEASCNATQSDVIKRRNRIINDDAVFHRLSANIRKKAS